MSTWENRTKQAVDTLKRKYNTLLQSYNLMEDGTKDIISNPVYAKLNKDLRDTARQIAELQGFEGTDLEMLSFFRKYELIKGFEVAEAVKQAA